MKELDKKDDIDSTVIDLLSSYGILKSSMEIFNDAVDYDTSLDNKYNNMVKVINMLVMDMEPSIEQLCRQLSVQLGNEQE